MEKIAAITIGEMLGGGATIAVLLSVFVEISPVKFNPISTFLKWMGKKMNGEVIEKVDQLEKEVTDLQASSAEQATVSCRARILRFGDEILHGVRHSKDHFDQTLRDVDTYESYCTDHPDFKNNITGITTEKIKDTYKKRLDQNDFL
ncbi:MAG: hypothetical protein RR350_02350 [Oscillibacter sp.]